MNQDIPFTQEDLLRGKGQLREHVFTSTTPVIGSLIARFRSAWNNVSTRWYVRPLADQQSEFNQALLDHLLPRLSNYDKQLDRFEEKLRRFDERLYRLDEMDPRIIAQDQRQVELTHDMGEVVARLVQLDRRLEDIESRIERVNSREPGD
jgi:predicted  nucleic acid-binding Zn-ribbon protein